MTIPTDAELLSLLDRLDSVPADAFESQYLDFKSWREAKQELRVACEYAACFANADGGVIVFGVDDKTIGRAAAIHGAGGFDLDTFQRGIYQGTRPSLSVQVSVLNVPEGTGQLLVVRVPAQMGEGPYGTAAGLFKQREGKNCMPLNPHAFAARRIQTGIVDWSGALVEGLSVDDLDRVQIERARNVLRARAPSSDLLTLSDQDLLAGLEAIRDGRVTHTGLLLFARRDTLSQLCPQAQFPLCITTR